MNASAHEPPPLRGLHHVTAVTGAPAANLAFYSRVLGLRLVKKTVNQDDVSAYHLFYGDELGHAGTELTFFHWPHAGPTARGAGTVSETSLRLHGAGAEALAWWVDWFDRQGVTHGEIEPATADGAGSLAFADPEGQRLRLVADPRAAAAFPEVRPWRGSPAPAGSAVAGLSAVTLRVPRPEQTARALTEILGFRPAAGAEDGLLFEVGPGGPGAQVRLEEEARSPGRAGIGGVHHVAWRVADAGEQRLWHARLVQAGLRPSGLIDRFYFQSLYFGIPGGILFELATDGPGFTADGEDPARLGEKLSLPPFLEGQREEIEAGLEPLDSSVPT